jgi:AcrR family transcriptional regulator
LPTQKRQRKPLSRDRVLRAALKLADDGGLDALTMRKLAQQLGVEAMSLYNHVENRDDIVDGMIDLVAGEIEPPATGADWRAGLRGAALSTHEALMRHRWAAGVWMTPRRFSERRMAHSDAILRTLRAGGFSEDVAYHAFHVLTAQVIGFTLYLQSFGFDEGHLEDLAERFLATFPADDYPDLAEHVRQHLEPSEARQGTFEFGLELALDGLAQLRS